MNDTLLDDWQKLLATVPNLDVFRSAARDLGKEVAKGRREKPKVVDDLISMARAHKLFGFDDEKDVEAIITEGLELGERDHEDAVDRERLFRAADEKAARARKGNGAAHESVEEIDCASWWRDPTTIPPREFLHGRHYARRNIGASIGGGGRLKTSHGLFEATEMAVGRSLTTNEPLRAGPLRAGYLSGEEDQDELDRRLAAIMQHYGITERDLGGRLFATSVRNKPLRFATMERGAAKLNLTALATLRNFIKRHQIDVFMIDPWVSFHSVRESENVDMDLLIKQGLGGIANETNSAGEIFHHPGKPKPGGQDTTVEDARGASAIIWAVRSARVFNFMTTDEATRLGISESDRRRHIRISNGKANLGPVGNADWIKIEVENLPNGDEVACVTLWKPPNPFEGLSIDDAERAAKVAQGDAFRADVQSPQWLGWKVAEQLRIPIAYGADNDAKHMARVKNILKTWVKNNVLKIVERHDEGQRRAKKYIVAGSASAFHKVKPVEELDDEVLL
jgi:hypothetical protein